jgi:Tfp pilus assembly protein PilF
MTDLTRVETGAVQCPHCGALNHPNAVVCVGCGVHLDTYAEVRERFDEQQEIKGKERREKLLLAASEAGQKDVRDSQHMMAKSLKFAGAGLLCLAVIVLAAAALLGSLERQRRERTQANFDNGLACMAEENFLCARDAFQDVLRQNHEYPEAVEKLAEARIGLAKTYVATGQFNQALTELDTLLSEHPDDPRVLSWAVELHIQVAEEYADSKQWQRAIQELDASLRYQPADTEILNQMEEYYDLWYQQEIDQGHLLAAWNINRQRNARFP